MEQQMEKSKIFDAMAHLLRDEERDKNLCKLAVVMTLEELGVLPSNLGEKEKGNRINGIRGLASFLDCSLSKAQDLKNAGKIPFYNIGKKVYFFENEVTNALKGR